MIALPAGARMLTTADGIDAADFFERSYRPQRLPAAKKHEINTYREALRWLFRFLKRAPKVADLTEARLDGIQTFIVRGNGYSLSRARLIKTRLSSIAKHAWRLGLLAQWRPVRLKRLRGTRPAFLKSAPPTGTLCAAFREHGIQQLERLGRSKNTINTYAAAIRQFDCLLGRYAAPEDLTDENKAPYIAKYSKEKGSQNWSRLRFAARLLDPRGFAVNRRLEAIPIAPGSLRDFFETSYRSECLVGADPGQTSAHRCTQRLLYTFLERDLPITELCDSIAADFFGWLLERGLSRGTVNSHRARLFAVWRLAVQKNILQRDPRVKKLRVDVNVPDAWSEEETAHLFNVPLTMTWRRDIAGIPRGKYFRALLLVAYWTGLRRSTLRKLRRIDLDLKTGWLNVPGSAIKNRRGKRCRLGPDAIEAIREIWLPERDKLFPWPSDKKTFGSGLKRIFAASGLPRSVNPLGYLHKMRRTSGTLVAKHRGMAAACEHLGHSGQQMTLRYIDPTKLEGNDVTEFLPCLTKGKACDLTSHPQTLT